jgi:hypothetical protein
MKCALRKDKVYSVEHSNWEDASRSTGVLWNPSFITVSTRARNWFLSWCSLNRSTASHPTYLGYILILSSYLPLGFQSGLFPSVTHQLWNTIYWRENYYLYHQINPLKHGGDYIYVPRACTLTILHSAHTVYLCVPYGSHNKQRLFP